MNDSNKDFTGSGKVKSGGGSEANSGVGAKKRGTIKRRPSASGTGRPSRAKKKAAAGVLSSAPLVATEVPVVNATEAPVVSTTALVANSTDAPVTASTTDPVTDASNAPVTTSTTDPVGNSTDAPVTASATDATTPPEPELKEVGALGLGIERLRIIAVCAKVVVRPSTGDVIRVMASTPSLWSLRPDGRILETGGPVAAALDLDPRNRSICECDGSVTINGMSITIPPEEDREQLVVEVPESFAGQVAVTGDMFAIFAVNIQARSDLDVTAKHKAKVTVSDQLRGDCFSLSATLGGQISAGRIKTKRGTVSISAHNGSTVRGGKVGAQSISIECQINAVAEFDALCSRSTLDVTADTQANVKLNQASAKETIKVVSSTNATVKITSMLTDSTTLTASTSASVLIEECDTVGLSASASINSRVAVNSGSAERGNANASINASVTLNGAFAVTTSNSINGVVCNLKAPLDAADLFLRAAKRRFDRKYWDDTAAACVVVSLATTIVPSMKAEPGGTAFLQELEDPAIVEQFVKGIVAAYGDPAVGNAVDACIAALKPRIGQEEEESEFSGEKLQAALIQPEVAALYQTAFVTFAQRIEAHMSA